MATAKEQLLSMMNPQQARLMDQQLRQKEIAQRAQGAGMLSGLVQAYTGMGDVAQRATGIMPMGATEAENARKRKLLESQAAQEKTISTLTGEAVSSNDIERLKTIRDRLIATEKTSAINQAQKIQKRIEDLEEAAKDSSMQESQYKQRMEMLEALGITGERATYVAKNSKDAQFQSFVNKKETEAKESKKKSYVGGVLSEVKDVVNKDVWNRAYALSEVGDYNGALKTIYETQPPITPQSRKFIIDNYKNSEEILKAQDEGKRWTGEWIPIPEEKETNNPVPLSKLTETQTEDINRALNTLTENDPELKKAAKLKNIDLGKVGIVSWFDEKAKFDKSQQLAIYNMYRVEAKKDPTYELKDAIVDYIIDGNRPKGKPESGDDISTMTDAELDAEIARLEALNNGE